MILKSIDEWANSFSQIKKEIWNVNSKIISQRLDEMQEEKFIKREIVSEKPIKIRYSLTDKWQSFINEIACLKKWAKKWQD